jgi:hypothetical protein
MDAIFNSEHKHRFDDLMLAEMQTGMPTSGQPIEANTTCQLILLVKRSSSAGYIRHSKETEALPGRYKQLTVST